MAGTFGAPMKEREDSGNDLGGSVVNASVSEAEVQTPPSSTAASFGTFGTGSFGVSLQEVKEDATKEQPVGANQSNLSSMGSFSATTPERKVNEEALRMLVDSQKEVSLSVTVIAMLEKNVSQAVLTPSKTELTFFKTTLETQKARIEKLVNDIQKGLDTVGDDMSILEEKGKAIEAKVSFNDLLRRIIILQENIQTTLVGLPEEQVASVGVSRPLVDGIRKKETPTPETQAPPAEALQGEKEVPFSSKIAYERPPVVAESNNIARDNPIFEKPELKEAAATQSTVEEATVSIPIESAVSQLEQRFETQKEPALQAVVKVPEDEVVLLEKNSSRLATGVIAMLNRALTPSVAAVAILSGQVATATSVPKPTGASSQEVKKIISDSSFFSRLDKTDTLLFNDLAQGLPTHILAETAFGIQEDVYKQAAEKSEKEKISPYRILNDSTLQGFYILVNGETKDIRGQLSSMIKKIAELGDKAGIPNSSPKGDETETLDTFIQKKQSVFREKAKALGVRLEQ